VRTAAWRLTMTAALAVAAGLAVPGPKSARSAPIPPAPARPDRPAPVDSRALGSPSCSSASCHGGNVPAEGRSRTSYHAWLDDPHAGADRVLYNAASRRIWAAYRETLRGTTAAHAWQAKECLACHAGPASESHSLAAASFGVGCEACHGPARDWIAAHHTAEWNDPTCWPAERKREAGFEDTKSLANRARVCADCHVGAADREVNHDLIAAGHPRLFFELSAFLDRYKPAHWDRNADRRRHPAAGAEARGSAFDAKAWLVGQIVTAERAAGLLAVRAERAAVGGTSTPWPEFTEYGCYACHHSLASPSWRQEETSHRFSFGNLPWGTWHFALVETLATESADAPEGLASLIVELRAEMANAFVEPSAVAERARALEAALASWAESADAAPISPAEVRRLVELLDARRESIAVQDWDGAAQLYLAYVPLGSGYRSAIGEPPRRPAGTAPLVAVKELLRFEPVSKKSSAAVDSPRGYDPERLKELLRLLGEAADGATSSDAPPAPGDFAP